MKTAIQICCFLAIIIFSFTSCKKEEDSIPEVIYTPVANLLIDGTNSTLNNFQAQVSADNSFTLQGRTPNGSRIMFFCDQFSGVDDYTSGGASLNVFAYRKVNIGSEMIIYTTQDGAPGNLEITSYNEDSGLISGSFEFIAMDEDGNDTFISNGSFVDVILKRNTVNGFEITNNGSQWTDASPVLYTDLCGPGSFTLYANNGQSGVWIVVPSEGTAAFGVDYDENDSSDGIVWQEYELGNGLQLNYIIDGEMIAGDFAVYGTELSIYGTFNSSLSDFDSTDFTPINSLRFENDGEPNISSDSDINCVTAGEYEIGGWIDIKYVDACANYISIDVDSEVETGDTIFMYDPDNILTAVLRNSDGQILTEWTSNSYIEIIEKNLEERKLIGQLNLQLDPSTENWTIFNFDVNF